MTLYNAGTPFVRQESSTVIETPRLRLRHPHPLDAQAVAAIANDRRVVENTSRLPYPYTLGDAKAFIAQASQDEGERSFVIALADGSIIGACGIAHFHRNRAELGYWLGVRFWGCGYATEAARALLDHAFTQSGYQVIAAGARVSNPASRRVLEKCGFQWSGVELRRFRAIASAAPVDCFRLDRGLWTSLKAWGRAETGAAA